MIQFNKTQSQFGHYLGILAKYNNSLIVIGKGIWRDLGVEEFDGQTWKNYAMSDGLPYRASFTTLEIKSNLYIFGNLKNFLMLRFSWTNQ